MKILFFLFSLFSHFSAVASEDIIIHLHETTVKGVLPQPYNTFYLKIVLDEESDNLETMELTIGSKTIPIPQDIYKKSHSIELGTLTIKEGMFRARYKSEHPRPDDLIDYIVIEFATGERRRVEYVRKNGDVGYHWGKDMSQIVVRLDSDVEFSYFVIPLEIQAKRLEAY